MRAVVLFLGSLLLFAGPAGAQPAAAPPLAATEADQVLDTLAKELEDKFVFPESGKAYAAALRARRAAGAYRGAASAEEFAKAVTADLQAVRPDRHLKLLPPVLAEGTAAVTPAPPPSGGIDRSGWLADGIAYIAFTFFPEDDETFARLRTFLDAHGSAGALIVDLRRARGGGLREMDEIFSRLYAAPVDIGRMDTRVAVDRAGLNPVVLRPTVKRVPGPEGVVRSAHHVVPAAGAGALRAAKLFVLTSPRTASAAEYMTLVLQGTGRATIIGEKTRGAGHYGSRFDVGHGYSAFIPVGRAFDLKSGKGWEGVGVRPDIEVPADRALDEALRLAGVAEGTERPLSSLNSHHAPSELSASAMSLRLLSMP